MMEKEMKEKEPIKTNWIVVTGPPSSGKTTTLNNLMKNSSAHGYSLVEEPARKIISEDIKKGLQRSGDKDYEIDLNNRVLNLRKETEMSLNPDSLVFMDRGTPDLVAYMRYYSQDDREASSLSSKIKYRKVFYLEPLETYERDEKRVEAWEFAQWMDENLPKIYGEFGYEVIRVPVFPYGRKEHYSSDDEKKKDSLKQRSRFILDKLLDKNN